MTVRYRGTYHLLGKTGNPGWKIKWFFPFHLGTFRKYGLRFAVIQFFYSCSAVSIHSVAGRSPTTSNLWFYVYAQDFHSGGLCKW